MASAISTSSRKHFIVFSDDWGVHPSSCQHLFRRIVMDHDVSWINTVGMRRPRMDVADLAKGLQKLGGMLRRKRGDVATDAGRAVAVYQPLMLPFADLAMVRRLNRLSVRRTLTRISGAARGQDVIVVTTVPNACDYVEDIDAMRVIYYCVDDFSEWPGLDRQLVLEMEAELISKADTLVATSPALFDRLKESGKPTHMLTHGVDIDLFASDAETELEELRSVPEPRACYFGLFDERSDSGLVAELASLLPEVSFVIAGRVETPVGRLRALANVHFIGNVPYGKLPSLIKGVQLLFLPYTVNKLSESLSPLKLKEYLATGRPVISTPIAAAREYEDFVHLANTVQEWRAAVSEGLRAGDGDRKSRALARLRHETWDSKAGEFLAYCR